MENFPKGDYNILVLSIIAIVVGSLIISSRKTKKSKTDNKFHKHSTAKEVIDGSGSKNYLQGKVAIVTGGNSGIGLETCKALAYAGCRVVLCSRSIENGQQAILQEIQQDGHGGYKVEDTKNIIVKQLDLADLKSVKAFAEDVLKTETRIDYLILNAGIMAVPTLKRTSAGFESQIGVNHFGHAYLTSLLLPKLKSQSFSSRVVVLSSTAQSFGTIVPDDLHFQKRFYSPWPAYGQSKLANLLYAKSLAEDLAGTKITAVSVYPGIISTGLWKENKVVGFVENMFLADKTIPQGASTTIWACVSPEAGSDELRGAYLVDCEAMQPSSITFESYATKEKNSKDALWHETKKQLDEAVKRLGL